MESFLNLDGLGYEYISYRTEIPDEVLIQRLYEAALRLVQEATESPGIVTITNSNFRDLEIAVNFVRERQAKGD